MLKYHRPIYRACSRVRERPNSSFLAMGFLGAKTGGFVLKDCNCGVVLS